MKPLVSILAVLAATLATAQRVIPISIGKPATGTPPLIRRNDWTETLANNLTGGGYYAQVEVGTPGQTVDLILDTGSSDVWVLDSQADLCTSSRLQRLYGGGCVNTFTSSKSSTYKLVGRGEFEIKYADGSSAQGDYFTDAFNIGGANLSSLQMGLARKSVINSGLLGIGYSSNVAADSPYPNIIDQLEAANLIGIKAYSLYLNDLQASTGTILLGGVDTEKYIGSLKAVPIELNTRTKNYTSFTVTLSSLNIASSNGNTRSIVSSALPVILDSGTTLSYLPSPQINRLWDAFGAVDDTDNTGLVYVDCKYLTNNASLTFDYQFGGSDGPLIKVAVDEIVLDNVKKYQTLGLQLPDLPFSNACSFGIHSSSNYYLLGDTFLRSAYVVYDLTNHQIALAQSNLNSTKSNIIEIQNDATAIPLVTGVASQVTAEQTATGNPGQPGGGPRTTGTGASGTTSASSTSIATGTSGSSSASGTASAGGSQSSSGNAASAGVPPPNFELLAVLGISTVFAIFGGALVAF